MSTHGKVSSTISWYLAVGLITLASRVGAQGFAPEPEWMAVTITDPDTGETTG